MADAIAKGDSDPVSRPTQKVMCISVTSPTQPGFIPTKSYCGGQMREFYHYRWPHSSQVRSFDTTKSIWRKQLREVLSFRNQWKTFHMGQWGKNLAQQFFFIIDLNTQINNWVVTNLMVPAMRGKHYVTGKKIEMKCPIMKDSYNKLLCARPWML